MKIITAKEMSRLDRESTVATEILMERAGQGLAEFIIQYFPEYPVCFVCGPGNNGGDGFIAARHLHNKGRETEVFLAGEKSRLKELPHHQAKKLEIEIREIRDPELLDGVLNRRKIVVDCILGTGFEPPLKPEIKKVLEIINKKSKITLSCDIPTGVNGDTGNADESSVIADATVTFEYPKAGHLKSPGSEYTGTLEVVKIGIDLSPEEYIKGTEFTVRQDCGKYFLKRSRLSHKKNYGHVLVIGGSAGMEGAPAMAGLGALRSGAGLVTLGVGKSISQTVAGYGMSFMSLILEENSGGVLSKDNLSRIIEFIKKRNIDCVVLGPGMSTDEEPGELCRAVLENTQVPVVLDADGINNVVGRQDILKKRKFPTLITPHPGEMSRLAGEGVKPRELSGELGIVVLLKGYRSVVSDGKMVYVNSTGNPGMATGGTGDILAGVSGSLIGQGMDVLEAARIACWVHGFSGDLVAWKSGQRYILPEDILINLGGI
jgi:NAD(P)H-hydrate epimerase